MRYVISSYICLFSLLLLMTDCMFWNNIALAHIFSNVMCLSLCHCQVPLGLAITWAAAFLLTEAGAYSYKGCDVNVPASNIVSDHCRQHVSRMKHCRVDTSHALKSSPWFRFPYPLQWGTPVFHWKMALVMCVVSIISSVDSVSFPVIIMIYNSLFDSKYCFN